MSLEERRLAVVDTRGINTDGFDRPLRREPARRFRMKSGEMKFRHRVCSLLVRAEIFSGVRPMARKAGMEQSNRAARNPPMFLFPRGQIAHRNLVVRIPLGLGG